MAAAAGGTPGNAELMRAIDALRGEFRDMRVDLGKDYVRKELQDVRDQRLRDQITEIHNDLTALDRKVGELTHQRDQERDQRDTQRTADRRLIITLLVTSLIGPVIVVLLLHGLGAAS